MKNLFSLLSLVALTACTSAPAGQPVAEQSKTDVIEEVMLSRRSIRQYTDQTVSRDALNQILKCGINAPNGQNRQAYEIRVVDNPALVAEISDAVVKDNPDMGSRPGFKSIFAGAPCVIFIANDTSYDVSQVDCGLLGENIMLSAWSMGLGTCCMAFPTRLMNASQSCAPYIERLGFSEGYNLLFCIVMGYPAEQPDAKPRRDDKIMYID